MIQVGSLVKILYPEYASEFCGVVEAQENTPGRWIIRLEDTPRDSKEALLLSLDESEIEVFG